MCFKCSPPEGASASVEHPVSRRFLDDAEDLVESGQVCDLQLRASNTGCEEERSVCEGLLCLRCCRGPRSGQGLSEASLERVERLAEAGMRCGVILGQGARSHAPLETLGVRTICDGDRVCFVCRQ